jgi:hypothetical protein
MAACVVTAICEPPEGKETDTGPGMREEGRAVLWMRV